MLDRERSEKTWKAGLLDKTVKRRTGEVIGRGEPVEDFPKLVIPIRLHPNPRVLVWLVTLTDGKTYSVALGNLRDWLKLYAR